MILTIGFVDKENNDQLNVSVTPRIVDVSFTLPDKLEFIMIDENGVSQKFGCDPRLVWFGVHLEGCDLSKLSVKKEKSEYDSGDGMLDKKVNVALGLDV